MKDGLITGRRAAAPVLAVALMFAIAPSSTAESICRDVTYTASDGRGTCSDHGGVAQSGLTTGPTALASPTARGRTVKPSQATTVQRLLASLVVAPEKDAGYERDLFYLWVSVGGCDTRDRVLARQNLRPANSGDCGATNGEWFSRYDGAVTSNPSSFDIDHMVPLAEAWDSGAYRWSEAERTAFANDLAYIPALIAVSASSNRSKGERDPAEWMPERTSYWCQYLRRWVGVKYRWQLAVDPVEKSYLASHLTSCAAAMNRPPIYAN